MHEVDLGKVRYLCNRKLFTGESTVNPTFSYLRICGFDVTDMVDAHPRDGVDFKISCPSCGHLLGFRRDPVALGVS